MGGGKERTFLIQQASACKVFIYRTGPDLSFAYSLWFECSSLQAREIWTFWIILPRTSFFCCQRQSLASSCCVTFPTSQHNCSQHNSLGFPLSFCLISHSALGHKTEATCNCCIVWSGNLFPQPQLEFTELSKQLSVKRFSHKKHWLYCTSLPSFFQPQPTFTERKLFFLSNLDLDYHIGMSKTVPSQHQCSPSPQSHLTP